MKKTIKNKVDAISLNRVQFPEDEARFPWLAMLLDAYAIIDDGLVAAIRKRGSGSSAKLACSNGCYHCCRTHSDIPVYPLEMVGIYWFSIEKLIGPYREILKEQLSVHSKGPCPFLINGSCSIHTMRPIACRQFNVFNRPCKEGEDPYYTRRDDVLTPIQGYADRAFFTMLPFYGVTDGAEKKRAIKDNLIHTQVRILQTCNWKELGKRMGDFDSAKK